MVKEGQLTLFEESQHGINEVIEVKDLKE